MKTMNSIQGYSFIHKEHILYQLIASSFLIISFLNTGNLLIVSQQFTDFLNPFLFLVSSLECYVCKNQEDNKDKCIETIRTCDIAEDRCLIEVRWGSKFNSVQFTFAYFNCDQPFSKQVRRIGPQVERNNIIFPKAVLPAKLVMRPSEMSAEDVTESGTTTGNVLIAVTAIAATTTSP